MDASANLCRRNSHRLVFDPDLLFLVRDGQCAFDFGNCSLAEAYNSRPRCRYLAELFEMYTSCALSAALFFKCAFAALTPPAGEYLCQRFGTFPTVLVAICTSVVLILVPLVMIWKVSIGGSW